jgi:hypothetical protein
LIIGENGANPITSYISVTTSYPATGSQYSDHSGILVNGARVADPVAGVDIENSGRASVGICNGCLVQQTHAQSGFADRSISPVGIALHGTYSYDAIDAWGPSGTAAITADGAIINAQNNRNVSAFNIYSTVVPAGWNYNDGIRSVMTVPAGSTAINTNNFGAYMQCSSTPSGPGGQCVNVFTVGQTAVNNSRMWGLNPTLNDGTSNTPSARTGRVLVGAEFDFTTANTTANGTTISGISLILNNLSANQQSAALQISSIGNGAWGVGLNCSDGSTPECIYAGVGAKTGP